MRLRTPVTFALVLTLLAPAAAAEGKRKKPRHVAKVRLASFSTCNELVGYARGQALRTGGGSGMEVRALQDRVVGLAPPAPAPALSERSGVAPAVPTAAPQAVAEDKSFSGTNNQEAAVDESDIVKTDGRRAYVVYGDRLLAIDVTLDTPKLIGALKLEGQVQEILLRGNRLLAAGSQPVASDPNPPKPGPEPVPLARPASSMPYYAPSGVRLTEIDISDPAAMKVARTLDVDGSYVSARLTGGTARVVLNTPPQIVADTAADRRACRHASARLPPARTSRRSARPACAPSSPRPCCIRTSRAAPSSASSWAAGRFVTRSPSPASTCSRCSASTSITASSTSTATP